jgi:hypothetical protein
MCKSFFVKHVIIASMFGATAKLLDLIIIKRQSFAEIVSLLIFTFNNAFNKWWSPKNKLSTDNGSVASAYIVESSLYE